MGKHTHRRWPWILVIAGVFLVAPEMASAQALTASQTFVSTATNVVLFIISVLNVVAWLVLSVLDHIMDPQFIFYNLNPNGVDTSLMDMLKEIWQFTRDLVNLGFAIALIVGAVTMIVTADSSKVFNKELLSRYVIALVLVNFSWFIPRVIFDVSQVMLYTVYQIPSLLDADGCTMPATSDTVGPQPCKVVLKYKFFERTDTIGENGRDSADGTEGWTCPLRPLVCVQMVPIDQAPASVRTDTKVLDGLVVNHARLQLLARVEFRNGDFTLAPGSGFVSAFLAVGRSLIKLVMVLFIHIAIVFPLIAMAVAFFIRIPVLWVSMAFMPLVALGFAFPALQQNEYGDLFWKWKDHFLEAVFLPIKVAIPFVIGFIMLNAGEKIAPPANFGDVPVLSIFSGIRDMWQLLWMGVAIFIIWHYSFKLLKEEKTGFMGMFAERIQGIGQSIGGIAAQIPLNVPFLPVPGRTTIDPATGKAMQERASIGQLLQGIDPRRIREEGRLGRFGSFSNRAGLGRGGPTATDPAAVQQLQNNSAITNRVVNNFNLALQPGRAGNGAADLDAGFKELRTLAALRNMREEQILLNLLASGAISQQRHDELAKRLRDLGRNTNTNVGGGPTPAPGGTPAP